jgi:hypothetical protein
VTTPTLAEHDYEPVWGLPERPPEGETILWQGRPSWWALARHALYLPYIAAYLAVMVAARVISVVMAGASFSVTAMDALWFLLPSLGVVGLIALFAWGVQRTTAYTITSRRVVFRFGIALEMSVNLPFALVQAAGAKLFSDGSGDVMLSLDPKHRISYLLFWPHVRPWHYGKPQPALRGIPDAEVAAQVLARALAAHSAMPVQAMSPTARPAADHGGATPQPA